MIYLLGKKIIDDLKFTWYKSYNTNRTNIVTLKKVVRGVTKGAQYVYRLHFFGKVISDLNKVSICRS